MSYYKHPTGKGYQYVMKWEDYAKYGLDKSKAWKEDHNPPIYPDCKREIIYTEDK
jgi:hypothetical protein